MELNSDGKGGKREGAGRKLMGVTRKVSITLPESEWILIDKMQANNKLGSLSEHFRELHMCTVHSTVWRHIYFNAKFDRKSSVVWK